MFRFPILALLGASLAIALPVSTAALEKPTPEQKLEKLLEGRVAGEPRNCISLPATSSSQIIDKTAIVYKSGNTYWVNRPVSGASSLNDHLILVTKTSGSQLCSIDTVQLMDGSSRMWRGFVSLGEFIPYRKAE